MEWIAISEFIFNNEWMGWLVLAFLDLCVISLIAVAYFGKLYRKGERVIASMDKARAAGEIPRWLSPSEGKAALYFLEVRLSSCKKEMLSGLRKADRILSGALKAIQAQKARVPASVVYTLSVFGIVDFGLLSMWYISQLGNGILIMTGLNPNPDPISMWAKMGVVLGCGLIGLLFAGAMMENRKLA